MPIPVFYTPLMVADSESASPSAAKPAQVVASWMGKFPIQVIEPLPLHSSDFCKAHAKMYVEGVLEGHFDNGFGNRSLKVAASLPYTSGAMFAAACRALTNKSVACAPVSGFHHAEWGQGMGYCTFNGLMVTALLLKETNPDIRVGILDLDMHYGNGTDNIIEKTQSRSWIEHFTGGKDYSSPVQALSFFHHLGRMDGILARMAKCDLVLYQAGADPHVKDPHGGWLTTEQLQHRDAMVFDALKAANVPMAWNLAGGYQVEADGSIPKVLEIHDNTMRECVRVYG